MLKQLEHADLGISNNHPTVTVPLPHEIWPPAAEKEELEELASQRQTDISIKGKTGIIEELENNFLAFLDNQVKFAITFNSGTSGLFAAYYSLGLKEGDEILGPGLTFHAALSPALLLNLRVKLVDIDIHTRCIDPVAFEAAITPATKAVTVVHQWGHPADMDAIKAICLKHNLALIEDCSHAHGSKYKGQPCGTFGDVAVFSFQAAKMIYAGEGGILVTNRSDVHEKATLLGHYRDRSKEEIQSPELQKFWITGVGQKYRMSPLNAVVAKHALKKFEERAKGRHQCLTYFNEGLKSISFMEPHYVSPDVDMGAWYGFKPLYKPEVFKTVDMGLMVKILQKEGLEISQASAPPLNTLPLYCENADYLFPFSQRHYSTERLSSLTNCKLVSERCFSFPTFYNWDKHRALIDGYLKALKKVDIEISKIESNPPDSVYTRVING